MIIENQFFVFSFGLFLILKILTYCKELLIELLLVVKFETRDNLSETPCIYSYIHIYCIGPKVGQQTRTNQAVFLHRYTKKRGACARVTA